MVKVEVDAIPRTQFMADREIGDERVQRELAADALSRDTAKQEQLRYAASLAISPSTEEAHWQERALCKDYPNELFYSEVKADQIEAKALCAECPVKKPCLEQALRIKDEYGIWGGTDPKERKRILRKSR
ncbi:MAG: WhiB family transcriptional regulator [Candidatus Saccharimonadales bacterium]